MEGARLFIPDAPEQTCDMSRPTSKVGRWLPKRWRRAETSRSHEACEGFLWAHIAHIAHQRPAVKEANTGLPASVRLARERFDSHLRRVALFLKLALRCMPCSCEYKSRLSNPAAFILTALRGSLHVPVFATGVPGTCRCKHYWHHRDHRMMKATP